MEFSNLIEERYSVRKFSAAPVEKERLDVILEAGRVAPTAHNEQPQRILVIEDRAALDKLPDCTPCHFSAPLALLICTDNSACWRHENGKLSGEIDASIVCTHMMLAATNLGLGCTWVMVFDPEKMREVYHIPEDIVPVALLPIGYPAENARPSRLHEDRKTLDETVVYNQF